MIIELVAENLYCTQKKKCLCNTFTMCSFFNKVFTAIGNNYTLYSKNRIGNRKFHSKLPIIVFQITVTQLA